MSKCIEIIDCFNAFSICLIFFCLSLLRSGFQREERTDPLLGGYRLKDGRAPGLDLLLRGFCVPVMKSEMVFPGTSLVVQ